MTAEPGAAPISTTVDRAGELLHLLAQHTEGLGINQLARALNTQRAPIGRILQALVRHRLVHRDANKRYHLGAGVLELAHAYSSRFPAGLESILSALADETGMTAMLIDADGDEMTTVLAKTPTSSALHVYTPPGFRHPEGPLTIRTALAATRPETENEAPEVREARSRGFALGLGKIMPGRYSAAAVVPGSAVSGKPLVLALVSFREFDVDSVGEPLMRAAQAIAYSGA
ncbi:helix-turn-helix domain-containing protein [Leucobacter sp. wl10]|uniref:helix-turn-helix domain-containing protein n=1 Tax=Leucobacter sp. wl10 TaxID=2304677 RepID=UPI000E5BCD11|nr:helix-turn-helix domain-containing protein [Leucobacter sp. wl10]RGE17638.1 hypothetical protein D1J51_15610 [Leucobacter sp. wl10]